jgi:predicted aldo/keto reductase-like oxidoreductase
MSDTSSRRFFLTGLAATGAAGAVSLPAMAYGESSAKDSPKITYATLGRTGLKVTRVGFGCMITSDASVVERAADLGINYFDTARVYMSGNNERMVGAALKSRRKDVILSTKALPRDPKAAAATLDTSLKELGTDYVDIWYLHSIQRPDELTDDLVEVQQKAKQAGKIRFAGMTTHTNHKEVIPAVIRLDHWDVMMVTYNFALDPSIEGLIKQARDKGMGTVAMKVMAGSIRIKGATDDEAQARMKRPGAPYAALKWSLRVPFIDTAIPSIRDMDQLDENIRAMSEPFKAGDDKVLAAHLDRIAPLYCRMCGACSGQCLQGLPVSDIIRYVTYADGYGEFSLARENYRTLPESLQAARCAECSTCSIQCPNGVRVRERVSRAQTLFA